MFQAQAALVFLIPKASDLQTMVAINGNDIGAGLMHR